MQHYQQIDYDFSFYDKISTDYAKFSAVAQTMQFDQKAKSYIKEHSHASVVNLGAGFDTGFYQVDNGIIHWYDLDLPEVIGVRKQLFPETDRSTCVAQSFINPKIIPGNPRISGATRRKGARKTHRNIKNRTGQGRARQGRP